jgi:uncharacterized protein YndB with AHSA1/START domain
MPPQSTTRSTAVLVVVVLGGLAFLARAISTLADDVDFSSPGSGWRALMQIALGLGLLASVRSARLRVRALLVVGFVHLGMAVWERFDSSSAFGFIAVTTRDRWAHPVLAVAAFALASAAYRSVAPRRTVSVTKTIDATPAEVFATITDIDKMGRLSPETTRCAWQSDARRVGARFNGTNRSGDREWTTQCIVTTWTLNEHFAFEVVKPARVSRWTYTLMPSLQGCVVTETWDDLRNPLVRLISVRRSGIVDRATHNEKTMTETLARLDEILTSSLESR